jgi:outer membrane immunogenic protein
MKKFILALSAVAAFSAPALAADMAAKAPMRAAPVAYAPSWTGCYVGGGGGTGMWKQNVTQFENSPLPNTVSQSGGGEGWFGTVEVGCDYQLTGLSGGIFGNGIVIGAFADYDFAALKGDPHFAVDAFGRENNSSTWAVGGRAGVLMTAQLLAYFSAGYTQAHFDQVNLWDEFTPTTFSGNVIPSHTYSGWFFGSGVEYATNLVPGLFWKTEYRYAQYDTARLPQICTSVALCNTLGPTGTFYDSEKHVQTIRTELVYRFNWGGPVVAKY